MDKVRKIELIIWVVELFYFTDSNIFVWNNVLFLCLYI